MGRVGDLRASVIAICGWLLLVPGAGSSEAQEKDPALDLYYVANGAYNRKLYPAAIGGFEEFLQKHGSHPKADLARRGLALCLYAQKQYEAAIPHLSELLRKGNLDAEISRDRLVMMQGQCLMRSGKKDEAKQVFVGEAGGLKDEGFKAAALAAICDISFGKQEWEEVRKWTAQLLGAKVDPDQAARGLYQQGFANYQLGKYAEAGETLGKIESLAAEAVWKTRASYLLGECFTIQKEDAKAEPAYAAALGGLAGADRAECHRRLGVTRFLLGKWEAAGADFEAYLKLEQESRPADQKEESPQVGEAKLSLGRCFLERGDFQQAERRLGELTGGNDETAAKATLWHARVFSRAPKPDYDRAAGTLEAAVGKFGNSPLLDDLRFDYANALMSRATPDWRRAAEELGRIDGGKFGQYAEVLSQRATCYHKLEDYQQSARLADEFLGRFPEHGLAGDTRFLRAENLFLLDQPDNAAGVYQQFLNAHRDHPNALAATFRIAQIHHERGRWDEVLAAAQPLLAKEPEGPLFAQLSFLVGDSHFRRQRWEEAAARLESFVATRVTKKGNDQQEVSGEPNVDTALMQLAVAYARTGLPEKALGHLETLTRFYPKPTPHLALALAEQGRLAYEAEDLKVARQALERFLSEDKQNKEPFRNQAAAQRPRVYYYLGWVESAEGKDEAAANCFGEVVKADQNHELAPDAALQQGIAMVNREDFAAAAKHFPDVLRRYPQHEKLARVTYYAGLALARQKDWNQAAEYLKRVVEAHPESEFADQALYEWAWCERSRERIPEAVQLYERFVEKHGKSPLVVKVQSELAELNLDSGAQDMVIERLSRTLADVKDESLREDIRYQLASAHYRKGDFEAAAGQFEELLKDYPQSRLRGSMLFQAGEARLKLKEAVPARDHFAAGVGAGNLDEGLLESMTMRLGEMQTATDEHQNAKRTYEEFLGRFRESQWTRNARFGLGWSMENTDDPEGAIREYAKLLDPKAEVDLWTVRARFQTGECYFNMQQYEKAISEFLHVEINFKEYPSWQAKSMLEIGRVLLAQGKREEAADRLKEVIVRFPNETAAVVARQYLDQLRAQ